MLNKICSSKADGANRVIEIGNEEKTEPMSEDRETELVMETTKNRQVFKSVMLMREFMKRNQIKRSKIILDLINQSETVTLDLNDVRHVSKETLSIKSKIQYNEQQPTKIFKIAKYSNILTALKISPHFVANTHSMQIVEASSSKKKHKKAKRTKRQTKRTPVRIYGFSSPEVKKLGSVLFKWNSFAWKHKSFTD